MRVRTFAPLLSLLATSYALAQADGPITSPDELFFETKVGSFKILGGADPARGKLTFSFTGTVLVNGMDGKLSFTGNVKKEFANVQRKQQAYFGTGTMTIEGAFRSVQWFGRDMKALFKGLGIVRLNGEYDKNLDTGWVRYGTIAKPEPWYQGGRQFVVPQPEMLRPVVPKAKGGF